jgi:Mrp family chromosome partitioning ATPase
VVTPESQPKSDISAETKPDMTPETRPEAKPETRVAPQPVSTVAPEPVLATASAPVRTPIGVSPEAIDGLARELGTVGDSARRIAVLGARRHVGTTLAAISLARRLAREGRVALIDLALGSPNLSAVATEPNAPGIAELVRGTASFGQIITRDRFSRVHIITAGQAGDAHAILASQRLSITIEALGRSYDHVVIDAGALAEISPERFAQLAPRAVLIADGLENPMTAAARERLIGAGFKGVSVLVSAPRGPELDATNASAAA